MKNPFVDLFWLGVEAQQVIFARSLVLMGGGSRARAEANKMVSEKFAHGLAEATHLATGGSIDASIARTRRKVRANRRRLGR